MGDCFPGLHPGLRNVGAPPRAETLCPIWSERTYLKCPNSSAGGDAACFENALLRVSREDGLKFADEDVEWR